MIFLKDLLLYWVHIFGKSSVSGMPFFVCYHALKPLRHGVGYVMYRGEQDFLPGLFEPSFQILHALGVGSLKTTSSIMLQTFSTGLMSGEFEGQHVFSIKLGRFFFCTMLGWPWLRVLAPRLGRTSCGDWNWTIFACLFLHSHFYCEGQASLLSLMCCWCSNRQSKSVRG